MRKRLFILSVLLLMVCGQMWAGRGGTKGEEGIQALKDAYNVQKEAERLATLDAVTIKQLAEDDYSYMLEGGVRFTFDGDIVNMTVNDEEKSGFTLSETDTIIICPARTFRLTANQDPDHPENYYSTFFTSERAYKVPTDGSAKAYIGEVKTGEKTDVLKLTDVGTIIHQSEAVILKATGSDITLMPSCNTQKASIENILKGIDEKTTLEEGDYAMTLGQYGVGFYKWANKQLGANKAYMKLEDEDDEDDEKTNAFTFLFNDGTTTGINSVNENENEDENIYNLNGMRVNGKYSGVIIKNGKKVFVK